MLINERSIRKCEDFRSDVGSEIRQIDKSKIRTNETKTDRKQAQLSFGAVER